MNRPILHAKTIVFTDGTEIHDRDCFILDGFVIVSGADPGDDPSYYNRDLIRSLIEVRHVDVGSGHNRSQIRFF